LAISPKTRFLVLRSYNYTCAYCGRRPPKIVLEVDHKIPISLGGSDELSNLIAACWDCNRGKGPLDADGYPTDYNPENYNSWEEQQIDSYQDFLFGTDFPWLTDRIRKPILFEFDVFAFCESVPHVTLSSTTLQPALDWEPF
jgi:hypothetical protein